MTGKHLPESPYCSLLDIGKTQAIVLGIMSPPLLLELPVTTASVSSALHTIVAAIL